MEAVIATGGKQYRVAPGTVIAVEKVAGDRGAAVEFRSVLFVNRDGEVLSGDRVAKARVSGEVVGQGRGRKIEIVKYGNGIVRIRRSVVDRYLASCTIKAKATHGRRTQESRLLEGPGVGPREESLAG